MSLPRSYANSRTKMRASAAHDESQMERLVLLLGKISFAETVYFIAYTDLPAQMVMPTTLNSSSYLLNCDQQS